MAKVKFRFAAFREIRQAPGVVADIEARTRRIAETAGEGFDSEAKQGRTRARGSVWTTTQQGRRRAASGDLVRALDAGR